MELSADAKPVKRSVTARLMLTVVGALLMIGPPYAFEMLYLRSGFGSAVIAAIELTSLAVGFVLLYVALRERAG
jgi:hypothetical protein